jgi:hypothetical protein
MFLFVSVVNTTEGPLDPSITSAGIALVALFSCVLPYLTSTLSRVLVYLCTSYSPQPYHETDEIIILLATGGELATAITAKTSRYDAFTTVA